MVPRRPTAIRSGAIPTRRSRMQRSRPRGWETAYGGGRGRPPPARRPAPRPPRTATDQPPRAVSQAPERVTLRPPARLAPPIELFEPPSLLGDCVHRPPGPHRYRVARWRDGAPPRSTPTAGSG